MSFLALKCRRTIDCSTDLKCRRTIDYSTGGRTGAGGTGGCRRAGQPGAGYRSLPLSRPSVSERLDRTDARGLHREGARLALGARSITQRER